MTTSPTPIILERRNCLSIQLLTGLSKPLSILTLLSVSIPTLRVPNEDANSKIKKNLKMINKKYNWEKIENRYLSIFS